MAQKTYTLFLAKPVEGEFVDLLSETARGRLADPRTQIIQVPNFGDGGQLYIFSGQSHQPGWLKELRAEFEDIEDVLVNSASALLIFQKADARFALTFAHGWMFLDDEKFEGDFGLRVALNALDHSRLRKLERANLGDALRGVSLSPFQREFTTFGVDDALDLVRKITGRTREDSSAESLTGSKSLKTSGEYELGDIPDIAEEALDFYRSEFYKETPFRIVDFVTPIDDPDLRLLLDAVAVQSIRDNEDRFELGLPGDYDDEGAAYKFAGPRYRNRHPDLLLRHYVQALGEELPNITEDTLRSHKIIAVYDDDGKPDVKWSIRKALIGSVIHDDARYAINEAEWYKIDQLFRQSVEQTFADLVLDWDEAPEPFRKIYDGNDGKYEEEKDYNARFAEQNGFILLDRQLVAIPDIRGSRFEACDILDLGRKRFLHIKKSSRRSNLLSHLFKQGSNSAQQLKRFEAAWTALRQIILDRYGAPLAHEFDDVRETDDPWTVEFVIADTPRANGQFNIPFFSKITLRDEVSTLRAMDYNVALRFIRLQP